MKFNIGKCKIVHLEITEQAEDVCLGSIFEEKDLDVLVDKKFSMNLFHGFAAKRTNHILNGLSKNIASRSRELLLIKQLWDSI